MRLQRPMLALVVFALLVGTFSVFSSSLKLDVALAIAGARVIEATFSAFLFLATWAAIEAVVRTREIAACVIVGVALILVMTLAPSVHGGLQRIYFEHVLKRVIPEPRMVQNPAFGGVFFMEAGCEYFVSMSPTHLI